jgi:hypothetical protein
MSHAEICPVCGGKGRINDVDPTDACVARWKRCHGCGGSGWVTVQDSDTGYKFDFDWEWPQIDDTTVTWDPNYTITWVGC